MWNSACSQIRLSCEHKYWPNKALLSSGMQKCCQWEIWKLKMRNPTAIQLKHLPQAKVTFWWRMNMGCQWQNQWVNKSEMAHVAQGGVEESKNDIIDVCSIAEFIDSRLSNFDFSILDFSILAISILEFRYSTFRYSTFLYSSFDTWHFKTRVLILDISKLEFRYPIFR